MKLTTWQLNGRQQQCPTCGGTIFFQPEETALPPTCATCELQRVRALVFQKEAQVESLQRELDRMSYTFDASEFKVVVGDTVRCLYGDKEDRLLEGECYVVQHIHAGQIMVEDSATYWQSHRFVLVESTLPKGRYENE